MQKSIDTLSLPREQQLQNKFISLSAVAAAARARSFTQLTQIRPAAAAATHPTAAVVVAAGQ